MLKPGGSCEVADLAFFFFGAVCLTLNSILVSPRHRVRDSNYDLQIWAGWLPEDKPVTPAMRGIAEANAMA